MFRVTFEVLDARVQEQLTKKHGKAFWPAMTAAEKLGYVGDWTRPERIYEDSEEKKARAQVKTLREWESTGVHPVRNIVLEHGVIEWTVL